MRYLEMAARYVGRTIEEERGDTVVLSTPAEGPAVRFVISHNVLDSHSGRVWTVAVRISQHGELRAGGRIPFRPMKTRNSVDALYRFLIRNGLEPSHPIEPQVEDLSEEE